jgi:hypothetical protein
MFLVEIEAGREQLFPSVQALAGAIKAGVIGPDSRIYHRASSSWLSITLHPEYRKAMAARQAEPLPLPPLNRSQWTFFGTESPIRQIVETADEPKSQPEATESAAPPRGLRGLFRRRRASSSSDHPKSSGS